MRKLIISAIILMALLVVRSVDAQPRSPCLLPSDGQATPVTRDGGWVGDTRESFDAIYGEPVIGEPPYDSPSYDVEGCMSFLASVEGETVWMILLSSPREEADELDFDVSDTGDWTVDESYAIVANLLPPDAELSESIDLTEDYLFRDGFSQTLGDTVPHEVYDVVTRGWTESPRYGGFQYGFHFAPDGKIVLISVSLRIEPPLE